MPIEVVKRLTCYPYYVGAYPVGMEREEEVVLSEAARELGMSHVSVWRHVDSGKLKARKVGPIWLIKRADLEAFKRLDRRVGRPRRPRPAAE